MNIPLDNLYHWIQSLTRHLVILYVFRPHGSKDIFDLSIIEDNVERCHDASMCPVMVCHDQEPLDFSRHEFDYDLDRMSRLLDKRKFLAGADKEPQMSIYSNLSLFPEFKPNWLSSGISFSDWVILLHSEKNSMDVDQFSQHGFVPVYYWSHAIIARDWYRFAALDARFNQLKVEKTFLVYCRDWMPDREYRLKFLDLLVSSELNHDCIVSTQHKNNQGGHLKDYQVQDPRFSVDTTRLLCIPDNNSLPAASADYDVKDINSTAVSVVLETVVDDKIHLTEKILRAIACAHPFVLLAGPGSLAYLRSYGFQTFAKFWDESYDQEPDTVKRMQMIIHTMQQIQTLTESDWKEIKQIADQNKQHFFSDEFIQHVSNELKTNLDHAVNFYLENRGNTYWRWRKFVRRSKLVDRFYSEFKSDVSKNTIQELRRHRLSRFRNVSTPIIGQ